MCFPLITSLRIASQELKDHVSKRELYRAKQRTSAYGLSWSEVVLPVLSVPDLKSFNLARLPPTDSWCCIGINRLLSPSESTYDEGRRDYQELRRKPDQSRIQFFLSKLVLPECWKLPSGKTFLLTLIIFHWHEKLYRFDGEASGQICFTCPSIDKSLKTNMALASADK